MDAARRYFTDAAQRHGTIDGQTVRIPLTQAALARRTGHAPSTVAAHLRALGDDVIQRSPEIVIAVPANSGASSVAPLAGDSVITIRLEVTIGGGNVLNITASPPATAATNSRDDRGDHRGLRLVEELKEEVGGESSSYQPPLRETGRDGVASCAAPNRNVEPLTDHEIDELLAPLHQATRRAHLRPMTSRAPLYTALRHHQADQVREAVSHLMAEINTLGTDIRSPFGVLVARARQGLPDMPARQPQPERPELDAPASAPSPSQPSPSQPSALDSLRAEELADLDAHVQAEEGGSIRMPPAMQRAMRLEYLGAWLQSRGQNEDTTSTPRGVHGDTTRTGEGHS